MENKADAASIARDLTICTLQNTNGRVFDKDDSGKPEAIGKAVAALYNAILENIRA